jgi:hypothetical protein
VVERGIGAAVPAPALPEGGGVIDQEARLAIAALVDRLASLGVLAP